MAIERDEINNIWLPYCDLGCDWKGTPESEQGKAQQQYLNHCKKREHRVYKKKADRIAAEEEKKRLAEEERILNGDDKSEETEPPEEESPEPPEGEPPGSSEPPRRGGSPGDESKPRLETLSDEEAILFYGDEGKKLVKRKKLERLLKMAPKISENVLNWVLENYDQDTVAQTDMNALYTLLTSCGVQGPYAQRIVQILITMEQKLMQNLQQGQGNTYFMPTNTGGQGQGQPVFYNPQTSPNNFPYFNNPHNPQWGMMNQYPYPYPAPQGGIADALKKITETIDSLKNEIQVIKHPPSKEDESISRDELAETVAAAVAEATKKPDLTKEDLVDAFSQVFIQKQKGDAVERIIEQVGNLTKEVAEVAKRPSTSYLPKDATTEETIEVRKLDIIGDKLDHIHDTVKTGMTLLFNPGEKLKERNLEDITRMDEELDQISKGSD